MKEGDRRVGPNAEPIREISYRIRWNPSQYGHGSHRTRHYGADGDFCDYVPFWRQPDARRIDLRQSLRSPFDEIYVRQSEQRSRIAVYVIADLSASMRFGEGMPKMRMLAQLVRAVALAAHRAGDAFGFIGCDEGLVEELFLPASRKRGTETNILERLYSFVPTGRNVDGLKHVAERLGAHRQLLFLASDFHMPLHQIKIILETLARHDVAPIVLRSAQEEQELPSWGLLELRDLESGDMRLTLMRPKLRKILLEEAHDRARKFERLCQSYGRSPFLIVDRFDADRLSEHLLLG
ncbi:DUF58 domain-containing protein [Methylocapsa acidiphila]|uniref:DUF58 domain-containing protein n=1 Tax=Methylocapsa acidiphila TaxID=133552 RepID=UPI00041F09FA|nr:DUF58 domain-containing protein [Methylocapsa acidiphila]